MARLLPTHPNLEYLKKQAKQRLPELRRANPAARLADAQHALAREYGFASWPKLKAHVLSLPAGVPAPIAPEAASPFAGTWTANVTRSGQHPANPFRAATIHFELSGDQVVITDHVTDEAGREETGRNALVADGQERAAEHRPGYSVQANWRDARTLAVVVKHGNRIEGRVVYTVSADGRTLSVVTGEQVIVLARAGGSP